MDYCAEGGDEDAVKDMIESLAEDERMQHPWTAPQDRSSEVLELATQFFLSAPRSQRYDCECECEF